MYGQDDREKLFLSYTIQSNFKSSIKSLLSGLLLSYTFAPNTQLKGTLFFNTVIRKDHKDFFDSIVSTSQTEYSNLILKRHKTINWRFIKQFISHWKNRVEISKVFSICPDGSLSTCTYKNNRFSLEFYCRWIALRVFEMYLSKLDFSNATSAVVLTDVWPYENVFIRTAKANGIKTVTLQHGIYVPDVSSDKVDVLNFWNIPSDYVLTWGHSSSTLFQKYSPKSKTIICGNPMLKEIESDESSHTIGIAFDIPAYQKYNQNMINIVEAYAQKNNYQIRIRTHPTDSVTNYTINCKTSTFNRDLDNCEVVVAHTTSMLFSYLAQGKKGFRYKSNVTYYELADEVQFSDIQSFLKCMSNRTTIDFKSIAATHIKYIDTSSLGQYKKELSKISGGEK